MPLPFDYSLDVQDPAQSMLQALKFRGALRDSELRQQAGAQNQIIRDQQIEQNRINFKQQNEQYNIKLEQQRAEQLSIENETRQNALFQTESSKYYNLPIEQQTQKERERILRIVPGGMKKQMQANYNSFSEEKKAQLQADSGRFYAGLSGNKKSQEITIKNMAELATKYEEDGRPENDGYAAQLQNIIKSVEEKGPESALLHMGIGLAQMPKGTAMMKAVHDSEASRQKTAQAKVDLAAKKASTEKTKSMTRLNNIKALHDKTVNPIRKKKLATEAKAAANKIVTTKAKALQEIQASTATADNLLGTAQKILNDNNLNDVLGSFEGSKGAFSADWIRTDETEFDTIALINTLGSQITMDRIGEMKGVLTDRDLEVLKESLVNIDRKQSEGAFRAGLNEIIRITKKARTSKQVAAGVEPTMPDVGPGAERPGSIAGHSSEDINAALKKYGF